MIIDTIDNLNLYNGPSRNLRDAIDFLHITDLAQLGTGSFPIDGDRIRCIVVDRVLTSDPDFWESHEAYIDIHTVVAGTEVIRYLPDDAAHPRGEWEAENDSFVYHGRIGGNSLGVTAGKAVILFPGELHQTNCPGTPGERVKKVILKVRAEETP